MANYLYGNIGEGGNVQEELTSEVKLMKRNLVDSIIQTVAELYSYVLGSDNADFVENAMINIATDAVYDELGNYKDEVNDSNVHLIAATAISNLAKRLMGMSEEEALDSIEGNVDIDKYPYSVPNPEGEGRKGFRSKEAALAFAKDNGISAYKITDSKNGQVFYDPHDTVEGLVESAKTENSDFTSTLVKYLEIAKSSHDIASFNKGLTENYGEVIDNLTSILSKNPTLLNMWHSLQNDNSFFTFEDFQRQLSDVTTGRNTFGHQQYSRMMDQLLGEDWLGKMLSGTYGAEDQSALLTRYMGFKESNGVELEFITKLESKYTGLTEALTALAGGETITTEQQLALAQAFISEGITSADKYNQHIQDVIDSISGLTSVTAKAKLSAIGEMFSTVDKYSNMTAVISRNRGRSGNELDSDALSLIQEVTGLNEDQIKDLGANTINLFFEGMESEVKTGVTDHVGKVMADGLVNSIRKASGKTELTSQTISSAIGLSHDTVADIVRDGKLSMGMASFFAQSTGNKALMSIIDRAKAEGYTGNFVFDATEAEDGTIIINADTVRFEGEINSDSVDSLLDKTLDARTKLAEEERSRSTTLQNVSQAMNFGSLRSAKDVVDYFDNNLKNDKYANQFLNENTSFADLLAAARAGDNTVSLDDLVKAFNSAYLGTNQYTHANYGDWFSRIFGKDWLSQAMNGGLSNSSSAKSARQSSLNDFSNEEGGTEQIEQLKKAFPELEPILDKVQKGLGLSTTEVKKLADAFILDGVRGANEFNESIEKVSNTLKGLSGSATEAMTALGDYFSELGKVQKIRNITNSAQGKTGMELTEAEVSFLTSNIPGADAKDIRKLDAEGIGNLLELLNRAADDSYGNYGVASLREKFLADLETTPGAYSQIYGKYAQDGKLTITSDILNEILSSGVIDDPMLKLMLGLLSANGSFSFGVKENAVSGSGGVFTPADETRGGYVAYDEQSASTYNETPLAEQWRQQRATD